MDEVGVTSVKGYDVSARLTIQYGQKFNYLDKTSGDQRVGYYDFDTGLFTSTSNARKKVAIFTHYPVEWDDVKKWDDFILD